MSNRPARDWGEWTPGKGVERLRTEMPGVMPDLTEEDHAAAEAIIAAASKPDDAVVVKVQRERDSLARRLSVRFAESETLRGEIAQLRDERDAAYARGISEGQRLRTEKLDALTRGAYEDGRGDGLSEGRRRATEGAAEQAKSLLQLCGACDCGLPMDCTCVGEDLRPAMLALVREVEKLQLLLDHAEQYARDLQDSGQSNWTQVDPEHADPLDDAIDTLRALIEQYGGERMEQQQEMSAQIDDMIELIADVATAEGRADAIKGSKREWAVGHPDTDDMLECRDEAEARAILTQADEGAHVISRLVGPWEPAEQPDPDGDELEREERAALTAMQTYDAAERNEPRPRMTDGCGPEHTYREGCELRSEGGAR